MLLAHILLCKYSLHLPLNRQSMTYAREGVDLDVSTLCDRVGAASATLKPLVDANRAHVFAVERIHADAAREGAGEGKVPRRGGCGPTCTTTARLPGPRRRRPSSARPTAARACFVLGSAGYCAAICTSGAAARTSASTWPSNCTKLSWNIATSLRAVSSNSALFCQVLCG
jgi:hypothetical protein